MNHFSIITDADVIANLSTYLGPEMLSIWLTNVSCNGSESSVLSCPLSMFGVVTDYDDCEVAVIRCQGIIISGYNCSMRYEMMFLHFV